MAHRERKGGMMNVLDKILGEIDKKADYYECGEQGREHIRMVDMVEVEEIIRSHINEGFNTSVTQWIPYTVENMPKKEGLYLVTCDDEKYQVKRMRFKNGIWLWNYGIYDGKILAWQPLPELYKPEEDNHVK